MINFRRFDENSAYDIYLATINAKIMCYDARRGNVVIARLKYNPDVRACFVVSLTGDELSCDNIMFCLVD